MLARRYALRDDGFGKQKPGSKGQSRWREKKIRCQGGFTIIPSRGSLPSIVLLTAFMFGLSYFVFLARDMTTIRYEDPLRGNLQTIQFRGKRC